MEKPRLFVADYSTIVLGAFGVAAFIHDWMPDGASNGAEVICRTRSERYDLAFLASYFADGRNWVDCSIHLRENGTPLYLFRVPEDVKAEDLTAQGVSGIINLRSPTFFEDISAVLEEHKKRMEQKGF